MKKEIKDYLHLYYERKVFAKFNDGSSGEMDLSVYYLRYPDIDPLPIEFKLILRPLSDMTEDESKKLGLHGIWEDIKDISTGIWDDTLFYPEDFIKLLKEGFDLFGLIESGLAIDATKLRTGSIA
jgi:hypothetical protein